MLLISCISVKAPQGSVPSRKDLHRDAFGGYITLAMSDMDTTWFVSGELIAVGTDSIVVNPAGFATLFPISAIDSARIIFFNTNADEFSAWSGLLILGTLSNGGYALITLPLATVTGIVTSTQEAKRINYLDYPEKNWNEIRKYARFPQGLPPGIRLDELAPRPSKK